MTDGKNLPGFCKMDVRRMNLGYVEMNVSDSSYAERLDHFYFITVLGQLLLDLERNGSKFRKLLRESGATL